MNQYILYILYMWEWQIVSQEWRKNNYDLGKKSWQAGERIMLGLQG